MSGNKDEICRVFNMYFPREAVSDPIIYNIGQMFNVVTVIRAATMDNKHCLMALELRGSPGEIDKALHYLNKHKVRAEPVSEESNG